MTDQQKKLLEEIISQSLPKDKRIDLIQQLPLIESFSEDESIRISTYQILNTHLGYIVQILEYPYATIEWPDSKPLEIMAELYPNLIVSKWYEYQLGSIIIPNTKPLYRIIIAALPDKM